MDELNTTGETPGKILEYGKKFSAAQYPCPLENSYTKKPYVYTGFG